MFFLHKVATFLERRINGKYVIEPPHAYMHRNTKTYNKLSDIWYDIITWRCAMDDAKQQAAHLICVKRNEMEHKENKEDEESKRAWSECPKHNVPNIIA